MLPLINIAEYLIHSFALAPLDNFKPDEVVRCQVETGFRADRDPTHPRRFGIRLSLRYHSERMPDANLPYDLRLVVEGYFECPLVFEGSVPKNVILNALMILYGVARGIVGQITGAGVNGKFVLPAIAFDDLVNKAEGTGADLPLQRPEREISSEPATSKRSRRKKKGGT